MKQAALMALLREWGPYEASAADDLAGIARALNHLSSLSHGDRERAMSFVACLFCKHCGGDDLRCQCWNDE